MHPNLYQAIADTRTLGRADALWLADQIVDLQIADLRCDPALPPLSYFEWKLKFDRSRARVAELIHAVTHGRAALDEVLSAIEAVL